MDEILLYLQINKLGNWMSIYNSLAKKEELQVSEIKKTIAEYEKENKDYEFITLISSDYPNFLKGWYKPPFIVFKKGNKLFYKYGKNLKESFEIKDGQEQKYQDFLKSFEN